MGDDREKVLGTIRSSLKTARLPAARATVPPRTVETHGDRVEMMTRFRRELEPIGGLSYVVENDEQAIEQVLALMAKADGKEYLAWSEADLPVRGLGEALRLSGYSKMEVQLPKDVEKRHEEIMKLERAAVGITGAMAGLADTGSLALVTGPTRPRLASLLPPMHIALLPTAKLIPTMAAFFMANPDITRERSNLVFVTGPSRTADIELTLTRGVHGPKFVHVILLDY